MNTEPVVNDDLAAVFGAAATAGGATVYMSGGAWRMEITDGQVRAGLAAVVRVVRAQVANELDAAAENRPAVDGFPEDSPNWMARLAFEDAAKIVREGARRDPNE